MIFKGRIQNLYAILCCLAFGVWCQIFTAWLFIRAWRLLQLDDHHAQGIRAVVLVGILQLIVLPFLVGTVIKFFVVLLKPSASVAPPQPQPQGILSLAQLTLCLVALIALLVMAILLGVWPTLSIVAAPLVNTTFRIAWALTIPGAIFCIWIVVRTYLQAKKEK